MPSPSDKESTLEAPEPDDFGSSGEPMKLETCANCGRTFKGENCPACGQQAGSELSVIGILGGFARELVDTERGLWRTFKDLTHRPGTTVRDYLEGARKPLTSPGRYLLVGAIVTTVASTTLQGIGASDSNVGRFAVNAAQGFSRGIQDPGEAASSLEGTAWNAAVQNLEQFGAYPALALVMIAGLVGFLYRALFRKDTSSPAEAFAVAAYATAHATILWQCAYFAFELLVHYGPVGARISTAFEWSSELLLFVYPGILTYGCFGTSVWNGVKGGFGMAWGYTEAALVAVAGLAGYAECLIWANPDAYSGGNPVGTTIMAAFVAFLLLVHGAFELYARYR